MTRPPLVAASPWRAEDAREGMLARAVSTTGTLGTRAVQVCAEPLMREEDGRRWQAVRFGGLADVGTIRVLDHGVDLEVRRVDGPAGSVRILVPAVTAEREVELSVPDLGADTLRFVLRPQRSWSVHVVHHSHFDFGYTDPQRAVFANQRSYLDSAVELAQRTADWPEDAKFRWAVESLWAFRDYERHRTTRQVLALVDAVRAGQIELTAMPFNLHTDVCSTDELHELLREARRISRQYDVPITAAMQTDVPGQVAGLPDALAGIGVRYLSVAHNWAGRSVPHLVGGSELPRLFRWQSPAGRSVLVWMTDSPHGLAYMEGSIVGFSAGYDEVDENLPMYLTALAEKGYPFPSGVFGAHGEAYEREPYPWDVLHLRTQGLFGDNGPAVLTAAEIVRRWNETWSSPTLRLSRNEDFFVDAEKRLGEDITTVEGDWGDWWVEGVGSAAVPVAHGRAAQRTLPQARTIGRLAAAAGSPLSREDEAAEAVHDDLAMWDEHTWGAGNSWLHADEGFDSGEQQWQWKVAHALRAVTGAEELAERASAHLGDACSAPADALASWLVVNTSGQPRSETVRFLVPDAFVGHGARFALRDGRTSALVPHREEGQGNENHREAGRWVVARVEDVPATGWVRLDVVPPVETTPSDVLPTSRLRPRDDGTVTIENEFLRVVLDPAQSCITSIVDLATGHELVESDSVAGFNAYVYDEYASAGGYNHLANKLWTSDKLELLVGRSTAGPSVVVEHVDDGLEQRIVHEFAAPGVQRGRVTLRLRRSEPRLLLENRLEKPLTRTKESAYFAFPFRLPDPTVRFEVSGGVTGDGLPHVPGAPRHLRAVREFVSLDGADGRSLTWVTRDTPLVQHGTIAVPYAPFPASTAPTEPGTVFAWIHNNLWDTNFPIEQAFAATFAFAVGLGDTLATTDAVCRPLRAVRVSGQGASAPASSSLVTVDDDRVRLTTLTTTDEGELLVRLQSYADRPLDVRMSSSAPVVSASVCTAFGDVLGDGLPVTADGVSVPVAPFDVTAVRLRFS